MCNQTTAQKINTYLSQYRQKSTVTMDVVQINRKIRLIDQFISLYI